ncbi:MAG: hypothetical protein IJ628_11015 [Bacteroidaceae bacterium]|nr:hypothetical protein [Bacteroidaceae bacterium]
MEMNEINMRKGIKSLCKQNEKMSVELGQGIKTSGWMDGIGIDRIMEKKHLGWAEVMV